MKKRHKKKMIFIRPPWPPYALPSTYGSPQWTKRHWGYLNRLRSAVNIEWGFSPHNRSAVMIPTLRVRQKSYTAVRHAGFLGGRGRVATGPALGLPGLACPGGGAVALTEGLSSRATGR